MLLFVRGNSHTRGNIWKFSVEGPHQRGLPAQGLLQSATTPPPALRGPTPSYGTPTSVARTDITIRYPPTAGSQYSCQPTVKLHILPAVWIFLLGKGWYGGAEGAGAAAGIYLPAPSRAGNERQGGVAELQVQLAEHRG